MNTVRLITCDSTIEAHLIKGRLLNEGINCILTNENFTNLMPFYNNMLGAGVQILVDKNDLESAREIIKDQLKPNNVEISCPFCGSKNVELGLGKKSGLKLFNIILHLLSAIPMGNLKPIYYCRDCKNEIK